MLQNACVQVSRSPLCKGKCVYITNNLTVFYSTKLFSVKPELPLSTQASSEVTALSPASTIA